jgi:glycosyltransferase involved in cell wall biosynthesis
MAEAQFCQRLGRAAMTIALLTTYLAGYRIPLYQRLAERHGLRVLCFGGGERYIPAWFADLDAQLAAAPFPAQRLHSPREALSVARHHDVVIAPFAGGSILPLAYAGARLHHKPFVLWASVWAQPRSAAHLLALPATRHIYRHADAVVAYGEHVKRFVKNLRGHDDDVFVAPQSVEPELFARTVSGNEIRQFRDAHNLPAGPIVLYVGRLVPEKGVDLLLDAWTRAHAGPGVDPNPGPNTSPDQRPTLVLIGDGPLAARAAATPRARLLGPLPRQELPAAYAAAEIALLPSVRTPRFREPWGLVCNEAMHQGCALIASDAVGAVAGGLVRHDETGVVVPAGDAHALSSAIDELLKDEQRRRRLGEAARQAVAAYTYDAMVAAFELALATAINPSPTGP